MANLLQCTWCIQWAKFLDSRASPSTYKENASGSSDYRRLVMGGGDSIVTMEIIAAGQCRGGTRCPQQRHRRRAMGGGDSRATPSGNGRGNRAAGRWGGTHVHNGNYRHQAMGRGYSTSKTTSLATTPPLDRGPGTHTSFKNGHMP